MNQMVSCIATISIQWQGLELESKQFILFIIIGHTAISQHGYPNHSNARDNLSHSTGVSDQP